MTNLRNEIKEIIEARKSYYLGVRGTDEAYEIGEYMGTSYEWDWENDCSTIETDNPIELGGVCTIDIAPQEYKDNDLDEDNIEEAIEWTLKRIEWAMRQYNYPHWSVVASDTRNPLGFDENDDNEVILGNARVIAIVK